MGELLSIALTVMDGGVVHFDWGRLGILSILIQWIVLTSAACLCPMRPWFRRQNPLLAGGISYFVVLLITAVFTVIGYRLVGGAEVISWDLLLTNLLLSGVFSGIVLRYFYLRQQLQNQQQAELTARIQALQARIRPHFLFNSMNSIASLIDFDPAAAEKMVIDLSELFRASLSDPGLIPLDKELQLCRRFVAIEQMRIGDRLAMDWQVGNVSDVMIPSLLLQPLIENSIYHGVQPRPEGGKVVVTVKIDRNLCHISVVNPVGDKAQATNKGNGLALDNIRNRLFAHYGQQAGMEITNENNTYSVALTFPCVPPSIT